MFAGLFSRVYSIPREQPENSLWISDTMENARFPHSKSMRGTFVTYKGIAFHKSAICM